MDSCWSHLGKISTEEIHEPKFWRGDQENGNGGGEVQYFLWEGLKFLSFRIKISFLFLNAKAKPCVYVVRKKLYLVFSNAYYLGLRKSSPYHVQDRINVR